MRKGSSVLGTVLTLAVLLSSLGSAQQRTTLSPEEQARRQAEREERVQAALASERPIAAIDSVWIEELTWMEIRDALAAGKTTVIVPTGGIEQNGPYLALGKHNYVLESACEGIARELGTALCTPIIKLVPEGSFDEPSGHMRYPGTLSLRNETFQMVLNDVASSLKAHGFKHIVMIGDSGGNQRGMEQTAATLNERWGQTIVHYIPEFYEYREVFNYMERELGITEPINEGLHDDYVITAMMMTIDPDTVRYNERLAVGKATINGLSIANKAETIAIGKQLLQFRIEQATTAIKKALARTMTEE
jgi:creatinine amidohydrolase/Fe(II)-dependent formamide hydrolase-like protein